MPIDETTLHQLPGASSGRGPQWLVQPGPQARRPAGPQAKHRRFSPSHGS